jgi:hypothetical protein
MIDIVLPCCIIHNFLTGVDIGEDLIAEVDCELLQNDRDPKHSSMMRTTD